MAFCCAPICSQFSQAPNPCDGVSTRSWPSPLEPTSGRKLQPLAMVLRRALWLWGPPSEVLSQAPTTCDGTSTVLYTVLEDRVGHVASSKPLRWRFDNEVVRVGRVAQALSQSTTSCDGTSTGEQQTHWTMSAHVAISKPLAMAFRPRTTAGKHPRTTKSQSPSLLQWRFDNGNEGSTAGRSRSQSPSLLRWRFDHVWPDHVLFFSRGRKLQARCDGVSTNMTHFAPRPNGVISRKLQARCDGVSTQIGYPTPADRVPSQAPSPLRWRFDTTPSPTPAALLGWSQAPSPLRWRFDSREDDRRAVALVVASSKPVAMAFRRLSAVATGTFAAVASSKPVAMAFRPHP
jgi:hypothetical protein